MPQKLTPKVLSWATDLDGKTIAQAARTGAMPFVPNHVALMPDAHLGLGATIGSVIPTVGAIIPAAVGVDIGCGMIAVETSLTASDLPDTLEPLLSRIGQAVPAGVGKGHQDAGGSSSRRYDNLGTPATDFDHKQTMTAARQMGSLGSGNHFVEICLPAAVPGNTPESVWVVLHSGSRGIGNQLARRHIKIARELAKTVYGPIHGVKLEDPDLAYFIEGTPDFAAYMTDLLWAQEYALANRETMMDAVLRELVDAIGKTYMTDLADYGPDALELRRINCHHNYTAKEHHMGRDLWITRKGAIRARVGDWGVIPGSMGTSSYIVKGLGNTASFHSSAHGAGRRMSRTQAKREFDVEGLTELMDGKTWNADKASKLLDEDPRSYKDIDRVMAEQADLVEIELELKQILNYKGA